MEQLSQYRDKMKTDIEIQEDVLAEIRWDPKIQAPNIGVSVTDGIVTLSGYVDSFAEKLNAERAAKRVRGVGAIAQEIKVILPGSSIRSDTEIARQTESLISWSGLDPDNQIHAKVEQGFITLSGEVEAYHQKETIQGMISHMIGVTDVCNLIEIKPKLSIPIVKEDIENALKRQAIDQAQKLQIEIDSNIVTISGRVRNW